MVNKDDVRKMLIAWRNKWYYYSSHDKTSAGFEDFQEFNKIIEKLKEVRR